MTQHILLCDDEVHILRAAQFKLSRAGFDVECAHNGLAAWDAICRRKPDLVVTDLQMPGLNGLELIERIRQDPRTQQIPVIMLTAKGYELELHASSEPDVVAVLAKPFSPRALLQLVTDTLAGATTGVPQ